MPAGTAIWPVCRWIKENTRADKQKEPCLTAAQQFTRQLSAYQLLQQRHHCQQQESVDALVVIILLLQCLLADQAQLDFKDGK